MVLRAPALPGAGISNRHDPRRKSVQASAQHPPEEAALGAMTAQVPVWRAVLVVLGVAVRCLLGRGLGTVRVDPRGDRGNSSDVGSAAHQGSGGPGARRGLPRAAPGVPKPDSRCPLPGARGRRHFQPAASPERPYSLGPGGRRSPLRELIFAPVGSRVGRSGRTVPMFHVKPRYSPGRRKVRVGRGFPITGVSSPTPASSPEEVVRPDGPVPEIAWEGRHPDRSREASRGLPSEALQASPKRSASRISRRPRMSHRGPIRAA